MLPVSASSPLVNAFLGPTPASSVHAATRTAGFALPVQSEVNSQSNGSVLACVSAAAGAIVLRSFRPVHRRVLQPRVRTATIPRTTVVCLVSDNYGNTPAVSSTASGDIDVESPFQASSQASSDRTSLPLTLETVELVLDELRPYLQSDGGDCKIVGIDHDSGVVRLELQGACSSCSASSVTLKMGIERTLKERIPDVTSVVAVMPQQEALSREGLDEVLDEIRPLLSMSGGDIELKDFTEEDKPRVVLAISGPAFKSRAVQVEVRNRIQQKFSGLQEVIIDKG